MQQQKDEAAMAAQSVGLYQHQRRADRRLSLLFLSSSHTDKKRAQATRVYWWKDGQTSPATRGSASAHNARRYSSSLFPLLPVRECAKPRTLAREERERKARITLRYGQRYGTLSVGRMADALKIVSERPSASAKARALQQVRNAITSLS
jgi:hypothetical protein